MDLYLRVSKGYYGMSVWIIFRNEEFQDIIEELQIVRNNALNED